MVVQTRLRGTGFALLRRALRANALFSAGGGLLLIFGARPLATFVGVNAPPVLALTGVVLVGYAAWLAWSAAREPLDQRVGAVAVALDAAWVVASVLVLANGWLPLTTAGTWAVAIIADIVAVFALVQFYALRHG